MISIQIATMSTYFYVSGMKQPVEWYAVVPAKFYSAPKIWHVGLSSINRLQQIENVLEKNSRNTISGI